MQAPNTANKVAAMLPRNGSAWVRVYICVCVCVCVCVSACQLSLSGVVLGVRGIITHDHRFGRADRPTANAQGHLSSGAGDAATRAAGQR